MGVAVGETGSSSDGAGGVLSDAAGGVTDAAHVAVAGGGEGRRGVAEERRQPASSQSSPPMSNMADRRRRRFDRRLMVPAIRDRADGGSTALADSRRANNSKYVHRLRTTFYTFCTAIARSQRNTFLSPMYRIPLDSSCRLRYSQHILANGNSPPLWLVAHRQPALVPVQRPSPPSPSESCGAIAPSHSPVPTPQGWT